MEYSLFRNEEEVVKKADEIIEQFKDENTLLIQEYKEIVKNYKRLLKQTKKLVKISDKQQLYLKVKAVEAEKNVQENRKVFGRYLTDEIVDALLDTEAGLSLGGERREITILTSDIRGFTAQSNQLPPEQVIEIINLYLSAMADVITQYQGTIDAFLGDGILVLFGAPIIREDDPERAVACAVAMQLAMDEVNEQIQAWGFAPLEMGIGINTGEVVVGNLGSEKHTKYSAIGHEVNLTYRIESYSVGGQIFISESTLKKVRNIVKIQSEKKVKPKGITLPINIYEVEGIGGKYNLYCHKEKEVLLPLLEEIPLQYAVIEGKHVDDKIEKGRLVKLSTKSALIYCEAKKEMLPKLLKNLKINLFMSKIVSEDIYAKVLNKEADEKSLYIHFTSVPVEIKKQLMVLYQSLDKNQ